MKKKIIQKTITLDDGRTITIETGKIARQADGACTVRTGNTILLATVVSAKEAKENMDFMPLTVEYKEKFASSGRFPGGFIKRETRPSNHEILISRLIDRALRPLFPEDYHAETFVNIYLISADKDIMPDALAGLAASAALSVSDIPFNGPISEARVARINGEFKVNPTFTELKEMDIDLIVGATEENIMMVEGEMKEVSEDEMIEAIKLAHTEIKKQCKAQKELASELEIKIREYQEEAHDDELYKRVKEETESDIEKIAKAKINDKHERTDLFVQIEKAFIEKLTAEAEKNETDPPNTSLIKKYFHDVQKSVIRDMVINTKIRLDGRKCEEIRPISCEIDYLPCAHGSALFTRGETQSLTTVTLGTRLDEQVIDEVLIQGSEKFVLHYNFPPFSTGDARPTRFVSRREVGHGNLAFRALKNVLPDGDKNPYTVRVVSDILESNGSSSMATVCAGTLALMDAGIQVKKPVSGIAMGLITEDAAPDNPNDRKYAILSDILGDEDHLGDMDFKVTGTKDGITACQMDIKVDGLPFEILKEALLQAKDGRLHILNKITDTISEPRKELKPHTPRIVQLTVPKEMIGAIIGPGGKIIQKIQEDTGATITIEEEGGQGIVDVYAEDKKAIDDAVNKINLITEVPEINKTYKGSVKSIVSFGAFIEILPGKEGLLHISEIAWKRIENVEDVLKEGDEIEVKLIDFDQKNGKLKLSRKALLPKPERNNPNNEG
jgi:polyribonucleotide nucleotidyltransferase